MFNTLNLIFYISEFQIYLFLPGDPHMATHASNTVGDHGDPADGDAGNQGIKKPHRRPAHPQGLTDDHELQFQSTKTSRYATSWKFTSTNSIY